MSDEDFIQNICSQIKSVRKTLPKDYIEYSIVVPLTDHGDICTNPNLRSHRSNATLKIISNPVSLPEKSKDKKETLPAKKSYNNSKQYIDEKEASHITGYSVAWFQRHRCYKTGPSFLKHPKTGKILYDVEKLTAWTDAYYDVEN